MKVRIPLKKINLIKTLFKGVDINSIFIVDKKPENKDTFSFISKSFSNFELFSDNTSYYILTDNLVFVLPHDYEIGYGDSVYSHFMSNFKNYSKNLSYSNQSQYISNYCARLFNTSKHIFYQLFLKIFSDKSINNITFSPRYSFWGSLNIKVFYRNLEIDIFLGQDSKSQQIVVTLEYNKFKSSYTAQDFSIDRFMLDYINKKEYNCPNIKELKKSFDDYLLLTQIQEF